MNLNVCKHVDFIIFWNNRNIRRKNPADLILAFNTFCEKLTPEQAQKCALLMHTQISDDNGTNLLSVVFQPSTPETKELINTEITSAISFWLPYIRIENLEILDVQDDPTLIHIIKITLKYSVNEFDTDSIVIFANEDSSQLTIE